MSKIDMFEHLANPLDDMKLETTYRLWRALPYFSWMVTERLVDLLKEKNAWRQMLKQDINNAIKCLKPGAEQMINKLVQEEEGNEYMPLNFETALCEKFIGSFLEYYQQLVEIGAVAGGRTQEERDTMFKKYMVDRAIFMIQLEKGDVFTFLDNGKYEEFTYDGFHTVGSRTYCDYISNNEDDGPHLYHCDNVYRPVLNCSLKK